MISRLEKEAKARRRNSNSASEYDHFSLYTTTTSQVYQRSSTPAAAGFQQHQIHEGGNNISTLPNLVQLGRSAHPLRSRSQQVITAAAAVPGEKHCASLFPEATESLHQICERPDPGDFSTLTHDHQEYPEDALVFLGRSAGCNTADRISTGSNSTRLSLRPTSSSLNLYDEADQQQHELKSAAGSHAKLRKEHIADGLTLTLRTNSALQAHHVGLDHQHHAVWWLHACAMITPPLVLRASLQSNSLLHAITMIISALKFDSYMNFLYWCSFNVLQVISSICSRSSQNWWNLKNVIWKRAAAVFSVTSLLNLHICHHHIFLLRTSNTWMSWCCKASSLSLYDDADQQHNLRAAIGYFTKEIAWWLDVDPTY